MCGLCGFNKMAHIIGVVVARLVVRHGLGKRLADSLETALRVGQGLVVLGIDGQPEETLSHNYACANCGGGLPEIWWLAFRIGAGHLSG